MEQFTTWQTVMCLEKQLGYADDPDAAVGTEKLLLLPICEVEQCCSVWAKKSYYSSCKMERKSRSLNISCYSIRLKSVNGTEEMEVKSRATFFTKRYFVHFKKENVPVRFRYVMCANIQGLFSLHSANVEMCDGEKNSKRNHICEQHDGGGGVLLSTMEVSNASGVNQFVHGFSSICYLRL